MGVAFSAGYALQRYQLTSSRMEITLTIHIFREGSTYVAHTPELDVSSCGGTKDEAVKNLTEAVRLFVQEAEKMGTLGEILEEAGHVQREE